MALSRDLVSHRGNTPYHYGDHVKIVSDEPQCNGEWVVLDTMNQRYKNRGDLFFMSRSQNTSCLGLIKKL